MRAINTLRRCAFAHRKATTACNASSYKKRAVCATPLRSPVAGLGAASSHCFLQAALPFAARRLARDTVHDIGSSRGCFADLDQRRALARSAACGSKACDAGADRPEQHRIRLGASDGCRVAGRRAKGFFVAPLNHSAPLDNAVEAAITRVLDAEAAARDAIVHARNEALEIAEQARARARRLALHRDERIRSVRAAFERKVAADVAALEAEAAALDARHDLAPAEIARLERAVAALAARLTGDPR